MFGYGVFISVLAGVTGFLSLIMIADNENLVLPMIGIATGFLFMAVFYFAFSRIAELLSEIKTEIQQSGDRTR